MTREEGRGKLSADMTYELDLGAYFARIGYAGEVAASGPRGVETLHALSAAHVGAIPFENLSVLLGEPIVLEPEALFEKLVRRRRGGYCFEQNGLFLEVLRAIGFDVTPSSARVRLRHPRTYLPPRTHVFLRVVIDGEAWLADVGVGAASLTSPIRFDVAGEQPTLHEPRRLVEEDGRRFHQIKYGDGWSDVYEFTGEEMPLIDRIVSNWYTSTHPNSHFRDRLMVAKALPEGRRATLQDHEFTLREATGETRKTTLESPAALLALLSSRFDLTDLTATDAARLFAIGASG